MNYPYQNINPVSNWKKMLRWFLFGLTLFVLSLPELYAKVPAECDEVLFFLRIQHMGGVQMPSVVCEEEVYISVNALFDYLKVKNFPSKDYSSVQGFFIEENNRFLFDKNQNNVLLNDQNFQILPGDFLNSATDLFIKPKYLDSIFGLKITSRFYDLSLSLESERELPAITAAKRAQMRANILRLNNEIDPDTLIFRQNSIFDIGTLNYRLQSNQRIDEANYNQLSLGLGGVLASGELLAGFNYNPKLPVSPRNFFYRWRYVNNNNTVVKQLKLGRVNSPTIATVFSPMLGVELTNSSTQARRGFGTYNISDYTQPGWIVELYINNILVDYLKADPSGLFSFDIPLMYGSTAVTIKTYGPWGEENTINHRFTTPQKFLPAKEFEYSLSAARVQDTSKAVFSSLRMNYGLSNSITIGGGLEYLSSHKTKLVPYFDSFFRLGPQTHLFSEYLIGVGFRSTFNYSSPSGINLEANYAKYRKGQKVIRFSFDEERRVRLSFPIRTRLFKGSSTFNFRQNFFGSTGLTNADLVFSGALAGIRTSISTQAFYSGSKQPLIFSNFSVTTKPLPGLNLLPQVIYEYTSNRITSLRAEIQAAILDNAQLNISIDRNFKYDQTFIQAGLRYNLPFANLGVSSNYYNNNMGFAQRLSGGISRGSNSTIQFSPNAPIGRGGVSFYPFLDINNNGTRDADEPLVQNLRINLLGGGGVRSIGPNGIISFSGLEPYSVHNFELITDFINSISWKVENKIVALELNPNQVRTINIPVQILGEVSGFVYGSLSGNLSGLGGVHLNIYNKNNDLVKQLVTESDGYFSYLGLAPGTYSIHSETINDFVDSEPQFFSIKSSKDGDYIDDLEIILKRL